MYHIEEKRAFTLIELLIVVAIIAILAAIAVPNFLEAQIRSKVSRVKADMRSVATAIEAYTVDYNMPPISPNSNPSSSNAYAQFLSIIPGAGGFSGQTVGVKTLTTPIAYIKALPLDPFLPASNVEPVTGYPSAFSRASYWYVNYLGAYRWLASGNSLGVLSGTSDLDSGQLLVRFNGPEGEATPTAWYMASPGPDKSYEDPAPTGATVAGTWDGNFPMILSLNSGAAITAMKTGAVVIYDTTNGTRSRGQIIRTSAGIAE